MTSGTVQSLTPAAGADTSAAGQVRRARAVVVTRTVAYVFTVVMLAFGLLPIVTAVTEGRSWWVVTVGAGGFAVVATAFIRLVTHAMRHPWSNRRRDDALLVTGIVLLLPVLVDRNWQVIGFLALAAVAVTFRPRYGLLLAVGVLVLITVERIMLDTPGVVFLTVQDVLTGAALAGIIVLVAFIEELFAARAEVARLAVDAERVRFARDLHDTLGHNLSAIALKSELALRLLDRDAARARSELNDVYGIARDSLRDVRTVVKGYRRDSLQRELEGVQSVLVAAGVRCEVATPVEALPAPVEEVLAWAVREAATNLLRHSSASRCRISMHRSDDQVRLDVANDGAASPAPTDDIGGSGLTGLAERLAPLGGTLTAGHRAGGEFVLTVLVPC
ncbi:sensor histidine kinase [Verrucosispora sp. FIM060022]|uniref:sensor histidine kinase n=1 Tax=Verrucosispora sp. FIM060022 TaxID=1479020 RepID=UPI000F891B76|nr:sensor histidine kinase [Verrucosispora sp. FIM060022]RUL90676.1 sensor histidine kinase [Verrucosispora sp. FIM060022]